MSNDDRASVCLIGLYSAVLLGLGTFAAVAAREMGEWKCWLVAAVAMLGGAMGFMFAGRIIGENDK